MNYIHWSKAKNSAMYATTGTAAKFWGVLYDAVIPEWEKIKHKLELSMVQEDIRNERTILSAENTTA